MRATKTRIHRALPALAAAAALAVAGCGGGLSKKELGQKASDICAKSSKEGEALGSPDLSDPAKATDYFTKAQDVASKQQDDLEGLDPAPDVKDKYTAFTDATGKTTNLLGDLGDAAKAKDSRKFGELIGQLRTLSDDVTAKAKAVDADKCG